jgi:hypothetical protein
MEFSPWAEEEEDLGLGPGAGDWRGSPFGGIGGPGPVQGEAAKTKAKTKAKAKAQGLCASMPYSAWRHLDRRCMSTCDVVAVRM